MATKKRKRRVPDKKGEFDNFLKTSGIHLGSGVPRRGEELGLSAQETDDWIEFKDDWNLLYPMYVDSSQRTSAITLDVNNLMKNFGPFSEPLLNRMATSTLLTSVDREKLNLFERDRTATPKGKIIDSAYVNISSVGGGFMKFRVRIAEDASRASMHPESDFIEVKWMILDKNPTQPAASAEGTPTLPTADQAPFYAISKKALFILELGNTHAGKYMLAFIRWANASNPANNGPWSLPVVAMIQ